MQRSNIREGGTSGIGIARTKSKVKFFFFFPLSNQDSGFQEQRKKQKSIAFMGICILLAGAEA